MTGNHVHRVGAHAGDPRQAGEASDLAAARRGESPRAAGRASSSAPAWPASPRTTAPARTASLGTVAIEPDGRIAIHCDPVEMGNGVGTALANRVALHLGGVADEVSVAQVDASRRSGSSRPAIPARWIRRRRTPRNAIRAGCRRSARRRAPRSAPMSARMARPRPRASSSASACGRRRSSCGASRRPIRGRSNGRRRDGRTASSPCRA